MTPARQIEILSAFLAVLDGRRVKDVDAAEVFRLIAVQVPDVTPGDIAVAGDVAKRAGSEMHSLAWHVERALDAERRRRGGR